jgi:hypothetical protein
MEFFVQTVGEQLTTERNPYFASGFMETANESLDVKFYVAINRKDSSNFCMLTVTKVTTMLNFGFISDKLNVFEMRSGNCAQKKDY